MLYCSVYDCSATKELTICQSIYCFASAAIVRYFLMTPGLTGADVNK